ncbi:MAG: MerC domain-containing protein [Betaproteobacteria bacterium]|nr:MerC domain-containing protein [Betaproteobacteria bacterium]MDH3435901.1 MerC domain-containing protein [Betaproteobacteria bacterium]
MKELCKQCTSVAGAGFAGACCLGVTGALSLLTAIGAGFLINDAFLIPLYLGFLGLSTWLLYRSARSHGNLAPFWTGLAGAVAAFVALWFLPALVYAGLAVMIASSVWDFFSGRRALASPR